MRLFICAAVLAACGVSSLAQSTPKAEVFGGFSYLNYEAVSIDLPSGSITQTSPPASASTPTITYAPRMNLYGWNGSVTANLLPWFGFTSDFSGDYSNASRSTTTMQIITTSPCNASCTSTNTYYFVVSDPRVHTFLFEPQFIFPAGRLKLFAHFLAGGMNRRIARAESIVFDGIPSGTSIPAGISDNYFLMAFGGGADWPIRNKLSWRTGADYLTVTDTITGTDTVLNHIRVTTGLVWRPGK